MTVNYNNLWKLLIDKGLKKYQLKDLAHLSSNTMAKLSQNKVVSMEVLLRICSVLECDISDICCFLKEGE